jgi:hypothetical protein
MRPNPALEDDGSNRYFADPKPVQNHLINPNGSYGGAMIAGADFSVPEYQPVSDSAFKILAAEARRARRNAKRAAAAAKVGE